MAFCWLFQSSRVTLLASYARRMPGCEAWLASPPRESVAHRMPVPTALPFADSDSIPPGMPVGASDGALRARRRLKQTADQAEDFQRIARRPDIDRRSVGRAVPIDGRAVHSRGRRRLKALDDLSVVSRAEVAHVVAIEDVHDALFAAADDQIRVRDEQRILNPEIFVGGIQERPVERREPVERACPAGLTLMKLFPKFRPPVSPLNDPLPVSA